MRGAQRLQSVSGDIRTAGGGEDVECKTVSGDVTVTGSGKKGLLIDHDGERRRDRDRASPAR